MDGDTLRRARAAAQLLHRPRRPLADAVHHLLAVQAQDLRQAPLALRARVPGLCASAVAKARERGDLVRAWGPRGTIHLMNRADVGWLTALLLPGHERTIHRRLAQEGVHDTDPLRLVERALSGQGPLSKVELGERLGGKARGQGIVYLAFLGARHGMVVLGPDRDGRPTYVHSGDWIGPDARPGPTPAGGWVAELAVRYLRAHAPAGPDDLAAWSGLPVTDCRAAFAAIGDRLRPVPDTPLWTLRSVPWGAVGTVLLPGFDEYLLGWRDRAFALEPRHARVVIPGGGVIRPAVVVGGRVVGTWSPQTVLFADAPGIEGERADVERFLST